MKPISLILLTALCALVWPQAANPNEWPIPGNIGHTGFSPSTVLKPPLKVKWMTRVAGMYSGESGNGLVVAEGKVLIQGGGNHLFCLDAQTGEQLWRTRIAEVGAGDMAGYQWRFYPCIAPGRVYAVFSGKGTPDANGLRCFDINTGDLLWKKDAGISTSWLLKESPQMSRGKIFLHSVRDVNRSTPAQAAYRWKAQVQAWDALTGDTLWTYTTCDSVPMNPGQIQYGLQVPYASTGLCVAGDTIFASYRSLQNGVEAGKTVALNLNGDTLWTSRFHKGHGSMGYFGDKLLFSGLSSGGPANIVLCLNPRNGDSLWTASVGINSYYNTAAMNGRFWSRAYYTLPATFSMTDGRLLNSCQAPSGVPVQGCSYMSLANGYAYASPGPALAAWNETGQVVWSFPLGSRTCADLAIAYDQLYAVGFGDGMVYCFENAE